MVERLISEVMARVPSRVRRALLGLPASPSIAARAVHALLNALPVPDEVALNCRGVLEGRRMKIHWRLNRSFIYGTWEPEVVDAVMSTVQPGSVAIDVGAYLGFYTLLLSGLVGPEGRVFAFEPLPESFRLLEENVAVNGCGNVRCVQKAIAGQTGGAELSVAGSDSSLAGLHPVSGTRCPRIGVGTTTLDEFIQAQGVRVDFLKIDVEGAECDVLSGAQRTIRGFRPRLLVELHHFHFPREQHPALGLLEECDYDVRWVDRQAGISHVLARPK